MTWLGEFVRRWMAVRPAADVAAAGLVAFDLALDAWREDIIDPKRSDHSVHGERSRSYIDSIIRGAEGVGWTWEQPYAGDGASFQWCGAFVASCWRLYVPLAVRRRYFPSTYRLDRWARYLPVDERDPNRRPKVAPDRMLAVMDESSTRLPAGVVPQAGDILLVGPVPHGHVMSWGAHVTLVESYDAAAGVFRTVEANATGAGPRGDTRQGVVRQRRPLGIKPGQPVTTYHARRLIRPATGDLG